MLKITKITNGHLDLLTGEEVGPSAVVSNDSGRSVTLPLEDQGVLQSLAEMWVHDSQNVPGYTEPSREDDPTFPEQPEDTAEEEFGDPNGDYQNEFGVDSL